MARRHVREGARCIARQREIINELWASYCATEEAEALLQILEETQRLHEEHLTRLEHDGGEASL